MRPVQPTGDAGVPDPPASVGPERPAPEPPDVLAVEAVEAQSHGAVRIRIGIILVLASWFPIAWLISASSELRAVIWGIQIVIGLIGVAIAGSETVRIAKSVGWRNSPRVVWRLLRSPHAPIGP